MILVPSRKPQTSEIISTVDLNDPTMGRVILPPRREQLEAEQAYWTDLSTRLGANDEGIGHELATVFSRSLRQLIVGKAALDFALSLGRPNADIMSHMIEWQTQTAGLLGQAYLLRELGVMGRLGSVLGADDNSQEKMLVDFDSEEPDKTALHVTDRFMGELGLEPVEPGRELWFEGETVYVRARRPAEPTMSLLSAYRKARGGRRVDRSTYTSLAARVKRRVPSAPALQ